MKGLKTRAPAVLAVALLWVGLTASASAPAQSERTQPPFRYYVACGLSEQAKPSHRCQAPRRKAAFFRSNHDTVTFKVCVKFPARGSDCSPPRRARKGVLYVSEITSNIRGMHKVSWFVRGKRVGVFNFLVPRNR